MVPSMASRSRINWTCPFNWAQPALDILFLCLPCCCCTYTFCWASLKQCASGSSAGRENPPMGEQDPGHQCPGSNAEKTSAAVSHTERSRDKRSGPNTEHLHEGAQACSLHKRGRTGAYPPCSVTPQLPQVQVCDVSMEPHLKKKNQAANRGLLRLVHFPDKFFTSSLRLFFFKKLAFKHSHNFYNTKSFKEKCMSTIVRHKPMQVKTPL